MNDLELRLFRLYIEALKRHAEMVTNLVHKYCKPERIEIHESDRKCMAEQFYELYAHLEKLGHKQQVEDELNKLGWRP